MTESFAPTDRAVGDGPAPRGMFWVAWRQRRSLIAITLGVYAAVAVAIIVRSLLRGRELAAAGVTDLAGCADPGMTTTVLASCERWLAVRDSWSSLDSQFGGLPAVICVLFGLGLGAAVIGHEFERGVSAFSFTQSISPTRWAATQLVTVTVTSVVGVTVLDLLVRAFSDGTDDLVQPATGLSPTGWWQRPLLMVGMICLAFVLSIVSRGSSGGFWGGLGVLVVAGIVLNFVTRSTGSSQSVVITCPIDGELCSRISSVVFRFRADDTSIGATPEWLLTLSVGAAVTLGLGFLLLRRRFR